MTDYAALLKTLCPRGNAAIMNAVAGAFTQYLPQYGIISPLRVAHFIAQAAHESDGFKTLQEYASGAAYEGRKDLGNTQPGDGPRFKGRGIFQLTGRINYLAYGKRLSLDLISSPGMAATADVSVRVACEYWKAKGLNAWADRDDVREITRKINGGANGLTQRTAYLEKAKALLNCPEATAPVSLMAAPTEEVPDAPIAAEPAKQWWQSTEIMAGGGGFLTSLLGALQSPWALGGLIVVVSAGAFGWIWYRRMQHEQAMRPT